MKNVWILWNHIIGNLLITGTYTRIILTNNTVENSTLGGDYMSAVYTNNSYGRAARQTLLEYAEKTSPRTCVSQAIAMPVDATLEDAKKIIDDLNQRVGARVVVLFVTGAILWNHIIGNLLITGTYTRIILTNNTVENSTLVKFLEYFFKPIIGDAFIIKMT
jgi:hypothetical protein